MPEARLVPANTWPILAAALLWSTGGLFIKIAPLPGLLVAGGRAVVTSLFYLAVLRPHLRRAHLPTALAYAGMILTFVTATKLTTAANAIFLQYTGTAWVLALGPRLLGERLRPGDVVALLGALGGMALCLLDTEGAGTPAGNALGAISGVFFAGTVLGMRSTARPGARADPQATTTLGNLLAAAVALPLVSDQWSLLADPAALGVLLYLGIVQMGIAYLLFLKGLRTVPAATASLLAMLEPVANPIWVLLGTGEKPGVWSLLGGAVVVLALGWRGWLEARRT